MTTETTEPDLVTEVEELLAKANVHVLYDSATHTNRDVLELLRHMVEEVKRLRLKVDAITGSRIRDLVEDDHDD